MSEIHQIKCDVCGKKAVKGTNRGWKSLMPEVVDRYPSEPHPVPVDLCSWRCVQSLALSALGEAEGRRMHGVAEEPEPALG